MMAESDRGANCNLYAVSVVKGEFSAAGIVYGDGSAEISHNFSGIDIGGYDPDSVKVEVITDTMQITDIPSITTYGMIALVALLLLSSIYMLYRRRAMQKQPA
jgi:hypothetical protein